MSQPARVERWSDWHGEPAFLTRDDLDVIVGLLAELAPGWSAELNHAAPNDSTIVVIPEGANDAIGPAFVLHRSQGRVELDQCHWDEYRKLGGYPSLDDALAALRSRLLPLVCQGRAGP